MAKKVLGIDIDVSKIKVAEITRKGRTNLVTQLVTSPLETGTIVGGKVANVQSLRQGLETLLLEQGVTASSAVLGLRSSWVVVKTHRFPTMTKRELEKALEFEVPDVVGFQVQSLADVYYDYFINSQDDHEIEVVVVACPRQNALPYMQAIREAGLTLEAIDVPALGWGDLFENEGRRIMVEISDDQTTIQVSLAGVFKVLRVVPIGIANFRQGVEESFACSPEEATTLCQNEGLDYLLLEGPGDKRVIRATVQQFVGSILQTLDFIRAQERATSFRSMLDEMIIMGDLADLRGFGEMLEKEVDLPVRSLRSVENLRLSFDALRPGPSTCYGSALALALRGLDQ